MAKSLAKEIVSGLQTQHIDLVLGGGGTDGHMNPPFLNLEYFLYLYQCMVEDFELQVTKYLREGSIRA